jgi:Polysaccharide deacetylase
VVARFLLGIFGAFALALAAPALVVAQEVVLLRSETTVAAFTAGGSDYAKNLGIWREFFKRKNIKFRELPVTQLEQVVAGVMVLPSAVALTPQERSLIDARLKNGVSLLGSWAAGARDAQFAWLGYGQIERWFGATVQADVRAESEDRFLLPFGETPLTMDTPAGRRIYLGKIAEPMLRVKSNHLAARYSVWARESSPAVRALGAVSFEEKDGARRVYFGFPEAAWLTAGERLDTLAASSIQWLLRQPQATKSAWPHPAQSAFFMEMDTEDKYDNALVFARQLEQRKLRSTFYSVTEIARQSQATLKALAEKHEIGLHGDVHDGFKGQPPAVQEERLNKQVSTLKSLLGQGWLLNGFRAPLESFDQATESALLRLGVNHHVSGVNASDEALPYFALDNGAKVPAEKALVVIPRVLLDDVNYVNMGISQAAQVASVMMAAFQDVVATRGIGLFSVHSQNFGVGSVLEQQVPQLLDAVVASKGAVWFPTGSQVQAWWRERERISLSVTTLPGHSGLKLRIEVAPGGTRLLRVTLTAPTADSAPTLQNTPKLAAFGAKLIALDRFRHGLVFEHLAAGTHEFQVNFR